MGRGAASVGRRPFVDRATAVATAVAFAVAFDPTNDRRAGSRYRPVAIGRDYADVAPTYGTYSGTPGGHLTTSESLDEEIAALVAC